MSNLYFYPNGYFFEKEKKNYKGGDLEFAAIDISTDRKGPVYTLVKNPTDNFTKNPISIRFDVCYPCDDDVPFDVSKTIHTDFEINSESKFYSIYPLLRQMFAFNVFSEDGMIHNHLFIQNIDIRYGTTKIHLDETVSDKELEKIFKCVHMTTDVGKIFKRNKISYIGLDFLDHKWEEIYEDYDIYRNKNGYHALIVPLHNGICMETCYVMSFEFFQNLHLIDSAMILIRHYPKEHGPFDYQSDGPSSQYESDFFFQSVFDDVSNLLEASIFIPQIILMESKIYDMETLLDIVLTIDGNNLYLTIDDKEMRDPKNSCIFFLMEKLLEINLYCRRK